MDEFEIIRRYFVPDSSSEDVVIGIGDDGAVLRPDASCDLVTVIDTLVAGVHFPQKMRPQDIAYRAVAVNVSDIAAMGARPRWMTCAITLTNSSEEWLAGFSEGLRLAAKEYQVELVGGDTTRGSECVVTVQITGDVAKGMALTRSGAQPVIRFSLVALPAMPHAACHCCRTNYARMAILILTIISFAVSRIQTHASSWD